MEEIIEKVTEKVIEEETTKKVVEKKKKAKEPEVEKSNYVTVQFLKGGVHAGKTMTMSRTFAKSLEKKKKLVIINN